MASRLPGHGVTANGLFVPHVKPETRPPAGANAFEAFRDATERRLAALERNPVIDMNTLVKLLAFLDQGTAEIEREIKVIQIAIGPSTGRCIRVGDYLICHRMPENDLVVKHGTELYAVTLSGLAGPP